MFVEPERRIERREQAVVMAYGREHPTVEHDLGITESNGEHVGTTQRVDRSLSLECGEECLRPISHLGRLFETLVGGQVHDALVQHVDECVG